MGKRTTALAAATGLFTLAIGAVAVTPAVAAQQVQTFTCTSGGSTFDVSVRVPDNHSSDNGGWSVGQAADRSGHYIPTQFEFSAVDTTTGVTLFDGSAAKGNGNANQNQQQITCSSQSTAVASDFFQGTPPTGVSPTDTITLTFHVTAVPKT